MFSGRGNYGKSVHVSSDGLTFGQIPTGYGAVAYSALHLAGTRTKEVSFGSTSDAIRWAQPTGNGHLLLQPGGQVVTLNGSRRA
jgi:hypothetical protein